MRSEECRDMALAGWGIGLSDCGSGNILESFNQVSAKDMFGMGGTTNAISKIGANNAARWISYMSTSTFWGELYLVKITKIEITMSKFSSARMALRTEYPTDERTSKNLNSDSRR